MFGDETILPGNFGGRQAGGNGTDRTWRTRSLFPHLTSPPNRLDISIADPMHRDFTHEYA